MAVSQNKVAIGPYSIPQLYSYFIVGYIVRAIVFSTRTADLGGQISSGDISQWLVKPLGVIKLFMARDLVDKLFNLAFMSIEFTIILAIIRPPLIIPSVVQTLSFSFLLIIATILFFVYSLLISIITFWSDQAWSSRFLFGVVLINLLSGQFIPLNLLPPIFLKILNFTPFPYLYYYPVLVWIGQVNSSEIITLALQGLCVLLSLSGLCAILWQKGLQKYQSYGG